LLTTLYYAAVWSVCSACIAYSPIVMGSVVAAWLSGSALASGHSDAEGWASEYLDVKNYKWRLCPVTGCFTAVPNTLMANSRRQRAKNCTAILLLN